ncbi:30S ribosomal protein S1 [Fulvivirgaceae bacterium BMA10]|uniref:30S ribosomal protein S1 n=1 Tax=Splendidivirga corallicola TaxID=3051826 RepID=A0ABT8KK20_9BACT|nr:30S ribosomal protein S1 [Fulvivirgaceae bacterium BMA10]
MSEKNEEFNWDDLESKGFGEDYSDKEKEELIKLYEGTLNEIQEKEVVTGTVVGITDRDVILNIGFKSDGLVSASEFRDLEDLKIGDEVQVYIEEQENANGQLVLSRRKAKIVKAWEQIQKALDEDLVIEGVVKRRTKGGLIVDIFGVEAFLPGSQIDVKPIRDFDVFVSKKMEVKVVKINYSNDNVVVSHKVLIEKDLEKQKIEILNNLEKGQVLEGVIKNMTNFGVFIDLGGVDGLLHITDISWGRINHPEEVLELDQKVNVVVLDFDDNKKRISLGMKQLTAHPWDSLPEEIQVGSKVQGSIVNVADYGAFLEIQPGVEGLIHVSEMSWSQHLRNPQDFINIGDKLEAVVLTLDREERKMSLGIKQLTEDPWTKQDVLTKYAVGTKHKGIVRNLTNFGLFIELEEGIDGLVHVSDLSWTKKIKHPSEFVKVNDELEVQVLELDVDNRRLALGHKQLEENPWDTFATVFTTGSTHKCTILSKSDKGAVLELPYGIEGFATIKHLDKADGTSAAAGETLDFLVLEFSKDDKRIVLSHTNTHAEPVKETTTKAKRKPAGAKSAISKINNESEKSTLGDLEALSALKSQMVEGQKAAKKKVEEKVEEPKKEAPAAKKEEEAPAVEAEAEVKEEAKAAEEVKEEKKPAAKKKTTAKAKKEEEAPEVEEDAGKEKAKDAE